MAFNFGNLIQGIAGNYSEQNNDDLQQEYGHILINEEEIKIGFSLIRDSLLFTNLRMIFIDKQGTTGKKTAFQTIFLSQIVNVELETAGFGLDDSELKIVVLENIYRHPHTEQLKTYTFEFPKNIDIFPLYRFLMQLAYNNREQINR
ncbi:MAG: PH domain-containing protein [Aerococcus sp.]|nr:PH domain-containing protein [Aerococcus sp.]